MGPLDSQRDTPGPMGRTVADVARLLEVLAAVDPSDPRTLAAQAHIPPSYTAFLKRDALRGARIGVLRQALHLQDGADPRVEELFEAAVSALASQGATVVGEFQIPGFEDLPRPPQTAARTRADWETFFAYEGEAFPIKSVAELRDAPPGKRVHPLHAARIAEIAAVTLAPEKDPETVQGRLDEQRYREVIGTAMDVARIDALVLPVWTHPPVLLGDRGQSPQGALTFIGSATQWPVVVVPIGFVGEQLPIGMQILGRPWREGQLLGFAYAYEQATQHRRPPPATPPLDPIH
jgi:Asp-tRNA(Asn)/Glu-tRNA(Gln) amidotransferase A subunit family amidase